MALKFRVCLQYPHQLGNLIIGLYAIPSSYINTYLFYVQYQHLFKNYVMIVCKPNCGVSGSFSLRGS